MNAAFLYSLAADVLLALHVLFVIFVVAGLLLIFIGKVRKWKWVFALVYTMFGAIVVLSWIWVPPNS